MFSIIRCVRFSADGKYLAVGCIPKVHIYDVETGVETWFDLLLVHVGRWDLQL